MSFSITRTTRRGCLDNIVGAIFGSLFGVGLCFAAVALIWFGEGRTNMAEVAAESVAASPAQIDPFNQAQLIAVTGRIEAAALGDEPFLEAGPYLRLERRVEMFAWVEKRETRERDTVGGGTVEETTYSYREQWTDSPESGDNFEEPRGHRNPPLPYPQASYQADDGSIGAYGLDMRSLELPDAKELQLTAPMVIGDDRWELIDNYLFVGDGSLQNPRIGDVRISYRAVPSDGQFTVFGAQQADQLAVYRTERGDELYRALEGSREQAIEQLQIEDTITDWLIRIGTLLMLWAGLALILGPINAVAGIIPALKQASGCLIGLLTFIPAFLIWSVTLVVAIVAHNIWLLIAVLLLVIGAVIVFGRRYRSAGSAA